MGQANLGKPYLAILMKIIITSRPNHPKRNARLLKVKDGPTKSNGDKAKAPHTSSSSQTFLVVGVNDIKRILKEAESLSMTKRAKQCDVGTKTFFGRLWMLVILGTWGLRVVLSLGIIRGRVEI